MRSLRHTTVTRVARIAEAHVGRRINRGKFDSVVASRLPRNNVFLDTWFVPKFLKDFYKGQADAEPES